MKKKLIEEQKIKMQRDAALANEKIEAE